MGKLRIDSEDRFQRRNDLKRPGKKNRHIAFTPFGRRITTGLPLQLTAEFIESGNVPWPHKKIDKLVDGLTAELDADELAKCIVCPLFNRIYAGWHGRNGRSPEMTLKLELGKCLADTVSAKQRKRGLKAKIWNEISREDQLRLGSWLMEIALNLGFIQLKRRLPVISPEWKEKFDQIREDMILADPSFRPLLSPPPDWTGWRTQYLDGFSATFVRGRPRHGIADAIESAFQASDFEHGRGVNSLQRVTLALDPVMVDLAERFAFEHLDQKLRRRLAEGCTQAEIEKGRDENGQKIKADIAHAKAIGPCPFWLPYNCDFRGRVNSLAHFNYQREDYVRAMFKFYNGQRIGSKNILWLEIHTANCAGENKKSFEDRLSWINEHRDWIKQIAADPVATKLEWLEVDEPFRFVAACRELASAWADPNGFVTHLPVCFDGSNNGIQHLAMLSRDRQAALRTNLIDSDHPQDVYSDIADHVRSVIERETGEHAEAWKSAFNNLGRKEIRKLVKVAVMAYPYGLTLYGTNEAIEEAFGEINWPGNGRPKAWYLAKKIEKACAAVLSGPQIIMDALQDLAGQAAASSEVLRWTSPTGMPVANDYREPITKQISVYIGRTQHRHTLTIGESKKINRTKAIAGAPANFVHSLDAAHLIKVVNRANAEGIVDILTVHDSFGCLASQALDVYAILSDEFTLLYENPGAQLDLFGRFLVQNASAGDNQARSSRQSKWPLRYMTFPRRLEYDEVRNNKYAFGT